MLTIVCKHRLSCRIKYGKCFAFYRIFDEKGYIWLYRFLLIMKKTVVGSFQTSKVSISWVSRCMGHQVVRKKLQSSCDKCKSPAKSALTVQVENFNRSGVEKLLNEAFYFEVRTTRHGNNEETVA